MMKAMLLAAGRGQRMGSLTNTLPKPLLQVGGQSLIERQIHALARAGIKEIVINVRHLAEKIMTHLGNGSRYKVSIEYSNEQDETLNTGGGIYRALALLGTQPFILASSDILTDFDFTKLPNKLRGLAHLVMVDNPSFHPQGDFALDNTGLLTLQEPKLTYGNIAVLDPKLFAEQKEQAFPLTDVLLPAIRKGQVTGEYFQGQWENVGTAEQLNALNQAADVGLK